MSYIMRMEFFKCEPIFLEYLNMNGDSVDSEEDIKRKINVYSLFSSIAEYSELCVYYRNTKEFGRIDEYDIVGVNEVNCEDVIIFSFEANDFLSFEIGEFGFLDTIGEDTLLQLHNYSQQFLSKQTHPGCFSAEPKKLIEKLRSVSFYTHWDYDFPSHEYEDSDGWFFKGIINMDSLRYIV